MKTTLLVAFLGLILFACRKEFEEPTIVGEWRFDYLLKVAGPCVTRLQETKFEVFDSISGPGAIYFEQDQTGRFDNYILDSVLGGSGFLWKDSPYGSNRIELVTKTISTNAYLAFNSPDNLSLILIYKFPGGVGGGCTSFYCELERVIPLLIIAD